MSQVLCNLSDEFSADTDTMSQLLSEVPYFARLAEKYHETLQALSHTEDLDGSVAGRWERQMLPMRQYLRDEISGLLAAAQS